MAALAQQDEPSASNVPTRPRAVLEIIHEEAPAAVAAAPPAKVMVETAPEPSSRPQAMLTAFQAIAAILAIRLLLMLALMGEIALATMAMVWPDTMRLALVGLFGGVVLIPLILLERSSRRK